ncbi:MAG: MinD/ParA family protein [Anaerolineae bacterium]|nr:MinD/ParA family protein [Anaerolineae bacterium]
MPQIISIHSFRGGTGKSNIAANIAYLLAKGGRRVGIIDTDVQSPGIHAIFGIRAGELENTLNNYLLGHTPIEAAAYLLPEITANDPGRSYLQGLNLWLIPASIQPNEIAQVLHRGYDVGLLNDGFHQLVDRLNLDVLMIDTHPGLNEETLLSIAISDTLCIVMRPDEQDYQGTAVTVDIANKLEVPMMRIVVNKLPSRYDASLLKEDVQKEYAVPVAGVLPLSEDVAVNASGHVFSAVQPNHPWSQIIRSIVNGLAE